MKLLWITGFLICLSGNYALAQENSTVPDRADQKITSSLNIDNEDDFQNLVKKTNTYIKLFNRSERGIDSWNRYQSWVDIKKGVTGKERYVSYGLYSLYKDVLSDKIPKVREAAAQSPSLPELDAAILNYAEILEKLHPLVEDAVIYYDREDYRDDDFAKAKEMHPKLVATFTEFMDSRDKIEALLDPIQNVIDDKTLALMERDEGRKYTWHKKRLLIESKRILDRLKSDSLKQAEIEQDIKQYTDLVKEFDDYIRNADDLPSGLSVSSSSHGNILMKLRDYRDARKSKNAKKAATAYNNAIKSYNNMIR